MGGRLNIIVERVVINVMDLIMLDNEGYKLEDEFVFEGVLVVYFVMIFVKVIVKVFREVKILVVVLNIVGIYVCNVVMFIVFYIIEVLGMMIKVGFIYVFFSYE